MRRPSGHRGAGNITPSNYQILSNLHDFQEPQKAERGLGHSHQSKKGKMMILWKPLSCKLPVS
ncbi:hypothetical protein ACRRTK_023405 [Alexandromys fortis]